eukprot:2618300-Rhodomonas_salina.2
MSVPIASGDLPLFHRLHGAASARSPPARLACASLRRERAHNLPSCCSEVWEAKVVGNEKFGTSEAQRDDDEGVY